MEYAKLLFIICCLHSALSEGEKASLEESCTLVLEHPKIHTIISGGEVYNVESECLSFYCEPAALNPNGETTLRQFATGCSYTGRCIGNGEVFFDDNCYRKKCVVTDQEDGSSKAKINFVSTVKRSCLAADGTCKDDRSGSFPCFLQDEYYSHCACAVSGKIAYLKNLMRFGAPKIGTRDGNGGGEFCFFPFKYEGEKYEECIPRDGSTWCSTTPDFDKDGKFGICIEQPTYTFTRQGYRCQFPFTYNNTLHHTCTMEDRDHAWCAIKYQIKTDDDWDYCDDV